MAENNQSYAATLNVIDDFDQFPVNSFVAPPGPLAQQLLFTDTVGVPPDDSNRDIFLEVFNSAAPITVSTNSIPSQLDISWSSDSTFSLEVELDYSQPTPFTLEDVLEFQIQSVDNFDGGATIQLELEGLSLLSCPPLPVPFGQGQPPMIFPLHDGYCPGMSGFDLSQIDHAYFLITASGTTAVSGAGNLSLESISVLIVDSGSGPVGGTSLPIDTTALLVSGAQSTSMWMIPVILAGIGITVFVLKRK